MACTIALATAVAHGEPQAGGVEHAGHDRHVSHMDLGGATRRQFQLAAQRYRGGVRIAGRTARVRIRVSALLITLYDPIRLAEDIAILDLASNGRVSVVAGQGYRPIEYHALDRDWASRGMSSERWRMAEATACWAFTSSLFMKRAAPRDGTNGSGERNRSPTRSRT